MVQLPGNVDQAEAQWVQSNVPGKSVTSTTATFNVWVCRFGVSRYSNIASMPLRRFTASSKHSAPAVER
ncbi:hypothetical protein BH11ACT6_BH11ACT6_33770 [soil metagenome]